MSGSVCSWSFHSSPAASWVVSSPEFLNTGLSHSRGPALSIQGPTFGFISPLVQVSHDFMKQDAIKLILNEWIFSFTQTSGLIPVVCIWVPESQWLAALLAELLESNILRVQCCGMVA